MKVAISTENLNDCCETESALNSLCELGTDTAEVYLKTFYEYRPEFAKSIAPNICGVYVPFVRGFSLNFEGNMFSSSRRVRGDGLYWFDQILRSAKILRSDNYIFRGTCVDETNIDCISRAVRETYDFCASYGVNILLENSHYGIYSKPETFSKLRQRVHSLWGVLNMAESRTAGYPIGMYLAHMSGAIAAVRISDVDKSGKICLPGEGCLNFKDILHRLYDGGFEGSLIIDTVKGADKDRLKHCVENVKELIYIL